MTVPDPPASVAERWAESEVALVEQLRDAILANGPMTFARFMETVLYDAAHGYYVTRDDRATRTGDFLTAPELHPIFGTALAAQVEEVWDRLDRPSPFVLREEAAGSGALGMAILERLEVMASPLAATIRYQPIETDPRREAAIRARLTDAGLGQHLVEAGSRDASMVGMVLANELLDALPVHRVTLQRGRFRERHVTWSAGWFSEVDLPPSTPALKDALVREDIRLVEGQVTEIGLAAASRRGSVSMGW